MQRFESAASGALVQVPRRDLIARPARWRSAGRRPARASRARSPCRRDRLGPRNRDDATVNVFTGQASYDVSFELPAGPGGFGRRSGSIRGRLRQRAYGVGGR